MADAAAAAKPTTMEPEPDANEEGDEEEGDEGDEGPDASGSGSGAGAGGGKKKQRKKKRKGKGSGGPTGSSIALPPAIQANLRIAPAPTPPKGSGKPGPDEAPAGRAALAARALKPGELVFEEAPVALCVFQSAAKPRCGYCGRDRPSPSSTKAGGGGGGGGAEPEGVPVPCSDACRASRLAEAYRLAAPALALAGDTAKETDCEAQLLTLVLVLACLQHLEAASSASGASAEPIPAGGAAANAGGAWCAGWGGVAALMDHRERMPPAFLEAVGKGLGKLWPFLPEAVRASVGPAEGAGVRLACVVNVNSHGCTAPETTNSTIGVGLFPLLAMLNHACDPNCAFVFLDGKVGVRALRPIAANEELTVTYLNLLLPPRDRRRDLLASKHFLCRCARCAQPPPIDALLGGVCCAKCGEKGMLQPPDAAGDEARARALAELMGEQLELGKEKEKGKEQGQQWRCPVCGAGFDEEAVDGYLETVEAAKLQGQIMYNGKAFPQARAHFDTVLALHAATPAGGASTQGSGSTVKRVTTNAKLRVHPSHHLLVAMLPFAVNACNQLKDFGAAAAHLRRMLAVLAEALPPNYPELGDYHHALGVALFNHLQPRLAAGGALPRKTLVELKTSFEKAYAVRRVALGEAHPLTRESREMVEATAGP